MNELLKAYYKVYGEYGFSHYDELNATGRWALYPDGDEHDLYLEHKGWFFKRWIHEDEIELLPDQNPIVFECGEET